MNNPPELEVLDQLQGGTLPLRVVASLFPDEGRARRAIAAMVAAGEVKLLDAAGASLSAWQLSELERQSEPWRVNTEYRVTMTDLGARRLGG